MTRRDLYDSVYTHLLEEGLLEYGARFNAEIIRVRVGIDTERTIHSLSAITNHDEIAAVLMRHDNEALKELDCVDHIRTRLLMQGKAIEKDRGYYRVLTPGENERKVMALASQGDKKHDRALELSRNSIQRTQQMRHAESILTQKALLRERERKHNELMK